MIFVAEKLFMSFLGIRPTGQILIGTIFAFYAYNALRVATELKKSKGVYSYSIIENVKMSY